MIKDKKLFTPGPLSTSKSTKLSMMHDFGSRDPEFLKINESVAKGLIKNIRNGKNLISIPIQGSGTFAVEAMIDCFIKKNQQVLLAINGAYGRRIEKICKYHKVKFKKIEFNETEVTSASEIDSKLKSGNFSHLIVVHCETTTGILNPLEKISKICEKNKVKLLVDAMSTFGGLVIDYQKIKFEALAASSNKCLEGVPGISFCITDKKVLSKLKNNSSSLSLDLYDQWDVMKKTNQWRFTPPTHVVLALHSALDQLRLEGGIKARNERYVENCKFIRANMEELGFRCIIKDEFQSPIILTFLTPKSLKGKFNEFYNRISSRGFLIYPGKVTKIDTFRIGCIGNIEIKDIKKLLSSVRIVMKEMKLTIDY